MDNGRARVKAACRLSVEVGIDRRMKKRDPAADDRAERLAQALRANLRRRKAQTRAVEDAMHADSEKPDR